MTVAAMDERERDFLAVIAYVYLQHGQAEHAIGIIEAILGARPHDHDVLRLQAYALLELKQFEECLDVTDYLLGGHGHDEPGYIWLIRSRALYGLGRHAQARELWNQSRQRMH